MLQRLPLTSLMVFALCIGLYPVLSAAAGEKGKWNAHCAAAATSSKTINIPDKKDHIVYIGEFDGVCFTDGGDTFLNNARYQLADLQDSAAAIVPGGDSGYKIFTATDGGQVFGKYQQTEAASAVYKGTWEFISGTGKYQGIKGHGTWAFHSISDTAGWDVLEGGEYDHELVPRETYNNSEFFQWSREMRAA